MGLNMDQPIDVRTSPIPATMASEPPTAMIKNASENEKFKNAARIDREHKEKNHMYGQLYNPYSPLNVGIPDPVEIPAPVKKTTLRGELRCMIF